jgi:amidase
MSKRISKAGNIKYALSGDQKFISSVEPGETFVVECAINVNDGTIRNLGRQLTEMDVKLPFVNGATGPIEVGGSMPGDMLRVDILDMALDSLASLRFGRASACFQTGSGARSSVSASRPRL